MLGIVVAAITVSAGALLCGAVVIVARRRYRQDGDVTRLLVFLVAAIVALVCGLVTPLLVSSTILAPATGIFVVTARNVVAPAYFSILLSVPIGMGWGWVLSLVRNPADATGQQRTSGLVVRGLAYCFFATTALAVVDLVGRLVWYGHDNSIGLPGLAVALVFLGLMMLLAVGLTSNSRNMSTGRALRQLGAGFGSSFILVVGTFIGALAVDSMLLGWRIVEALNVLILFYPFYLGGSFAIAGLLLFWGGRMFTRTWLRLSPA